MREERGAISGNLTVEDPMELWGKVTGDVRVVENGKMYMRGSIYGDLIVEYGGRVHIYGHVSGNLYVRRGAKVINSGSIAGDAINDGGRLYIERDSNVLGKVKTNRGETTVEPKFKEPDNPFA